MEYEINRIQKTKARVLWYVTIDGVRLNSTNYATKWEAVGLFKVLLNHYGKDKIISMVNDHKKRGVN